jgi:proton-translocating NADH-quinone oxidoreductase chain M
MTSVFFSCFLVIAVCIIFFIGLKFVKISFIIFYKLLHQLVSKFLLIQKSISQFFLFINKLTNLKDFIYISYSFFFFIFIGLFFFFFNLCQYLYFFISDLSWFLIKNIIHDFFFYFKYFFLNLQFIFFFFFAVICLLFFYFKKTEILQIKQFSIYSSLFIFVISLCFIQQYIFYSKNIGFFQFYWVYDTIPIFAVDGLSLLFLLLTTFIFPLCFLIIFNINYEIKKLIIFLFSIELLLIAVFTTMDLFSFYIYFEMLLIPMSLIIVIWGSRSRKLKAMFYFFIYTLFSSLFMLVGIIILYFFLGTTNFFILQTASILQTKISYILWPLFFFAFAVKIPMFPFHLWLPEAHVEAPTVGSVILAGLLLKLGGYGFLRVLLGFFPLATIYYKSIIMILAILGIVYASFTLLRQIDMKKLIAYSSITHMNLAVIGIFSDTYEGVLGGIYLLISHGFSSSALFFLIGIIYERFHTRLIHNYGGMMQIMPKYGFFFFCFTLANFGFPGTANFIAESIIILNLPEFSFFVFFLCGIGILLSVVYSLLLFSRVMFGNLNYYYRFIITKNFISDIRHFEQYILYFFLIVLFIFGISTTSISMFIYHTISLIINYN